MRGVWGKRESGAGRHYEGQDESKRRHGLYGRISVPEKYLEDRYRAVDIRQETSKVLDVPTFLMRDFGGKNDCVPVAITRIFDYARGQGYAGIPEDRAAIYRDALARVKARGYSPWWGTLPFFIAGITKRMAKSYGYDVVGTRGVYGWSYGRTVVREIDAGWPLILNLARGSYRGHTVTVIGYREYSYRSGGEADGRKNVRFLAVADSWTTEVRWIDFGAMAYDVVGAGVASFNTMRLIRHD